MTNELQQSFTSKLQERLAAKGHKWAPHSTGLLMDISGSMSGEKIKRLREIAHNFTKVRRFIFSSTCQELRPTDKVPEASGTTAMHSAFMFLKSKGIRHTVIITDGEPDDEGLALDFSVGMKVDVIYVGPEPAPPFLEKLAGVRGGKYGTADIMNAQITEKIMGLLPEPERKFEI